jgi:oligopeptide/dipeptide ABC transporter ATP-binding protein
VRRGPSRTPMEGVRSNPASEAKRQSPHHPENLLEVRDLSVRFCVNDGHEFTVLDRISFDIAPGEVVGLLGESGSGKTTLALSLLRLLPPAARLAGGSVGFGGRDLLSMNEKQLREVRGAEISLVYQDSSVLNPVIKVGDQVTEVIRAHHAWPRQRAREAAQNAFTTVGLRGSDRIYTSYPHQLSGGQRQRVMIAQALVCKPALMIADEPTASLDATTAAEIVNLIKQIKESSHTSFLFITHEAATLARLADRVMVMYSGQIVEDGPTQEVLSQPQHPYTRALLECAPQSWSAAVNRDRALRLACIPGSPPDPMTPPPGCSFSERCKDRLEMCDARTPEEFRSAPSRRVRCFKYGAGQS